MMAHLIGGLFAVLAWACVSCWMIAWLELGRHGLARRSRRLMFRGGLICLVLGAASGAASWHLFVWG